MIDFMSHQYNDVIHSYSGLFWNQTKKHTAIKKKNKTIWKSRNVLILDRKLSIIGYETCRSLVISLLFRHQNVFYTPEKKILGTFEFSTYHQLSFSSVLTLAEAKKQFAKHFSLIFKFPLRFKRNLIHMFLIHLHSTHKKKCSSIWSHCGPGALKSFQMSLPPWIEIQMLCFVSSKQIWNSEKSWS